MHYISDMLYWIATGLLVPVVILLIVLFIRALLLLGSFFGQYISIKKVRKEFRTVIQRMTSQNVEEWETLLPDAKHSPFIDCIKEMTENHESQAKVRHLVDNYEIMTQRELYPSNLLLKMGPMLGLMGTLIPMGPALVGLSSGDIASMAYNMQVAFATTVVGLASSAIGFITKQFKQNWYAQDLADLEYLSDLIEECHEKK